MIVMGGSSMHKGANGWQAARAIACLPALTGGYGIPGGGMGPRHGGRSHGAGFADISAAERRLPGRSCPQPDGGDRRGAGDRPHPGAVRHRLEHPVVLPRYRPDAPGAGARRSGGGPGHLREPDDPRGRRHVVLPGTIWLEEIGAKATATHVYLSDRALPPAGQARPVWQVLRDLADRLGVADVYPGPTRRRR
jgi:anaerobic selenocysteine-containing dehydrogenase